MKKLFIIVLFFGFLFSFAQVDRSIGPGQYKESSTKKTKVDYVQESVKLLKEKLGLDDLQAGIVKLYVEESYQKIEDIRLSTQYNYVEKNGKMDEIHEKMKNNITEILTPEQKKKYEKLTQK